MNYKNRGMLLESIINKTLKVYSKNNIAIFHKKSIPITFAGIKKNNGRHEITKGWIETKSTTDYYGIYKGRFIAFEAKSTKAKSLPLTNIKDHQKRYLEKISTHGGLAFFIVAFFIYEEHYLISIEKFNKLDAKSISIEFARKEGIKIDFVYPGILDFIWILDNL